MNATIYRYCDRMTEDMADQLIPLEELLTEILECQRRAAAAAAAAVFREVEVTPSGLPVNRAALEEVLKVQNYWITRRDAARRLVPRRRDLDAWMELIGINVCFYGNLGRVVELPDSWVTAYDQVPETP